MEIDYMQDHTRKYLILRGEWPLGKAFEEEMLCRSSLTGLLRFYKKETDEKKEYFYDITGKRSLESVMENRKLEGEELCRMLFSIQHILKEAQACLLDLGQFLFSPGLLFVEGDSLENLFFCYLPGCEGGLMEGIRELFRFALTKIDHGEKETMMLGYDLYRVSMEENQGLEPLLKIAGSFLDRRKEEREREQELLLPSEERNLMKSSGTGDAAGLVPGFLPRVLPAVLLRFLPVFCIAGVFLTAVGLAIAGFWGMTGRRAGMLAVGFLLLAAAAYLYRKGHRKADGEEWE